MCQRSWLYLEPIFSSEDIIRQLPVESKRYQTMERIWRKIMKQAKENPEVILKFIFYFKNLNLRAKK
jgi:dynein heavy chain, axonemal